MARWVCHLAVLLAAWQGPVPWCHAHDLFDHPGTAASAAESERTVVDPAVVDPGMLDRTLTASHQLALHLCLFHPGLDLHDQTDLGWHFHFRLPGSEKASDGPPARTMVVRLKGERADVDLEQLSRDGATWWSLAPRSRLVRDVRGVEALAASPHSFFESFASELALPHRFCVYLI